MTAPILALMHAAV